MKASRVVSASVIALALAVPLLLALGAAALALSWRPELPDPVATHWDSHGVDGTGNQDLGAPEKVLTYFERERFQRIEPWLDTEGTLGFHFGGGLPVSVLYDARGKEVWRVTGDLDWADPEVRGAIGEGLDG